MRSKTKRLQVIKCRKRMKFSKKRHVSRMQVAHIRSIRNKTGANLCGCTMQRIEKDGLDYGKQMALEMMEQG